MMMGAVGAAQTSDKRTYFTFSRPITLPGITLPAGKYLFRLADSNGSRTVIQVASADGRKSYALLYTIPRQRLESTDDPEVRFMETGRGTPSAVKTWWYPGETIGYEFIYPKKQARLLVRGVVEPILTTHQETVELQDTQTAELTLLAPTGQEAEVASPPPAAPTGVAEVGLVAKAELPQTASNLPLLGFLGLLALVGGGVLRFKRTVRA